MSGCDRELNAHFYSAASLKYHAQYTWHDTTPSHIISTLGLSAKREPLVPFLTTLVCHAQDQTRNIPFPGADTLPTELPGYFSVHEINNLQVSWKLLGHWRNHGYKIWSTEIKEISFTLSVEKCLKTELKCRNQNNTNCCRISFYKVVLV